MECPICYTNAPTYVINCGSTVEHKVCDTCEITMRMKEPATSKGRLLKCPMCRITEKEPGERSSISYKYELSQLYGARPRETVRWEVLADNIRLLSRAGQLHYIRRYPELRPYFENYVPADQDPIVRQVQAQVAQVQAQHPQPIHAFCQSGRRESGLCQTRSKTQRKCTYLGCNKFVCRSCRQCLTH